jgi:mono/diheme cytochrome c family protein
LGGVWGVTRFAMLAGAAVVIAAASGLTWLTLTERNRHAELELGARLYAQRCASCHGAKLQGQPNWQTRLANGRMPAPPHDASGHTWHHSDAELFTITKDGLAAIVPGYQNDMPAFAGVLTDAEINAVLAFVKSTWPEREREYQARTTADRAGVR